MITQAEQPIHDQITSESEVLFRAWTVFPFDFFPDEIVVDRLKISIITHVFFGTQEIKTIAIQDVFAIHVDRTPFFAKVKIYNRTPMIPEIDINFLQIKDAMSLHAVVQGLLMAKTENIMVDQLPRDQMVKEAKRLGRPRATT